ncbi:MAG: TadE/TadG family type IV pilus assembly protein [Alphaproteobacteria bacterium]|jgi:Flp pilus assembly protein TadG|nr:TadE/TadG family type IV pilus assembly protein [Alphaproteobacteria bacterium]MDP6830894.1 TadE/TadG family type IV pilus assembly protein [Alphaproteobacteria bacterium]MDP6872096.1 TadE/TadG family type IV pilus assembly protein [Alphaproteobacteria bacterium]
MGKLRQYFRLRRDRRGAIAIEFALILPVLLLILFGIVEFGAIMFTRHVMFYSAREAARAYVTGIADSTEAAVTIAEDLLSEGNANGTFTVTATTSGLGTTSALITINIETPMVDAALVNAFPDYLLGDEDLSVTTTMYLEDSSENNTDCGKKKGSCSSKKTSTSSSKKSSKKK